MSSVYRWTVGDSEAEYDTFAEADAAAKKEGSFVTEYEYEYADSSIVADYR